MPLMVPNDAVIDAMLTYGGNFIHHLALAFRAADVVNQERLKYAFRVEWDEYAELAMRDASKGDR